MRIKLINIPPRIMRTLFSYFLLKNRKIIHFSSSVNYSLWYASKYYYTWSIITIFTCFFIAGKERYIRVHQTHILWYTSLQQLYIMILTHHATQRTHRNILLYFTTNIQKISVPNTPLIKPDAPHSGARGTHFFTHHVIQRTHRNLLYIFQQIYRKLASPTLLWLNPMPRMGIGENTSLHTSLHTMWYNERIEIYFIFYNK